MIPTGADPVATCRSGCGERQLSGKELEGAPPGELGRRGLGELSSPRCLPGAASPPEPRTPRSQRGAGGRSLGGRPGAASGRVEAGEAGQARAGAETQRFFWELAEAGVEEGGSEKPQRPGPPGRDAGEVKATGHRGRPSAGNHTSAGARPEGGAR